MMGFMRLSWRNKDMELSLINSSSKKKPGKAIQGSESPSKKPENIPTFSPLQRY